MNKNVIIAFAIWTLTILFPFRMGYLENLEPGITGLVYFLLTLVGAFLGALFLSKSKKQHS